MAEYTSDCLNINMEVDEDVNAVEKETAVNGTIDLGKSKTANPEDFQKLLVPLEIKRNIPDRETEMLVRAKREVMDKLRRIRVECSSDPEESNKLKNEVSVYFRLEGERRTANKFVASNRHCSQLKKVWINRGLPVDRESLQSAAASKDASGMGSFSGSFPLSSPYGEASEEIKSKAKRLAKEFYDLMDEKRLAIARSQITRFIASNNLELNYSLPSCLSNVQQPGTLTNMGKNVCRDMRNIQRFSFRPMIRTYASLNFPELREFPMNGTSDCDLPQSCEGGKLRVGPIIMNCNGNCGLHGNVALRLQKTRESVLLDRQMSRLNIANSRRRDLSKDKATIDPHLRALLDRLKDPNIDEQEKAAVIKQRNAHMRALLKRLDEERQATIGNWKQALLKK